MRHAVMSSMEKSGGREYTASMMGVAMRSHKFNAVILAAISVTGVLSWISPAAANCYQILAPNRWQYITQCNNSGGGGGGDYGAAIGAATALAPVAIDLLGNIFSE